MPCSSTACPPITGRRPPRGWWTAPRAQSGSRRPTASTPSAGCSCGCSAEGREVRLAKPQRQHRVARILEQHAVSSQTQVVELLSAEGVVVTQATVSRDLKEL